MLAQLKANGIEPVKGPESAENGKFAWILDPDGNKVELWEPMLWDDKRSDADDHAPRAASAVCRGAARSCDLGTGPY